MTKPLLTYVHFTDTHIGPSRDYSHYGTESLASLQRIISVVNSLPEQPDFVLHGGDVSEDRSPESYVLAAEVLDSLNAPLYFVAGNHDDPALMRQYLGAPAHSSGEVGAPLDYCFEFGAERFIVLDTSDPEVPDPMGKLSDAQINWLREEGVSGGVPLTLLIHHAPFRMASPWLDENMLLANGELLHDVLLPARDRLRGVFFGHLHRTCQITRDGILYSCAGSSFSQLQWHPWNDMFEVDRAFPQSYNIVQYFRDYVVVTQYAVPAD
jgi:Icc protein